MKSEDFGAVQVHHGSAGIFPEGLTVGVFSGNHDGDGEVQPRAAPASKALSIRIGGSFRAAHSGWIIIDTASEGNYFAAETMTTLGCWPKPSLWVRSLG